MDEGEPRPRRRGYFLHSDTTGETDHNAEYDNPEGVVVRTRGNRRPSAKVTAGRSHSSSRIENTRPEIRSGSVTGSRQRAHLPR